MTVSMLLSDAPRSFVLDREDFVVALLTAADAHGRHWLRRVRLDLASCAATGVREHMPGEPSSDDVRQRDHGAAVAARLPLGSPGRLFYRDLSRAAEASIRATTLMDEAFEEEGQE